MEVDRNGLEVLSRDECLRLLASATIGRVGISVAALPVVLPVNFRLHDERVVFRTGIGTKLDAATTNSVVAFEVDDFDPFAHTGWSVCLAGIAREVSAPDVLEALHVAELPRWVPSGESRVVAVDTERISGRRLGHLPQHGLR